MKCLVHMGGGVVFEMPTGEFVDQTVAKPRNPVNGQLVPNRDLARRASIKSERSIIPLQQGRAHRYGPTTFADLHEDQCHWKLASGHFCGRKTKQPRMSWCAEHDDIAHGRAKHLEAAE